MGEQMLNYARPRIAQPAMLTAAFWLLVITAFASAAYAGFGVWGATTVNPATDPEGVGVVTFVISCGTLCTAASVFCAIGIHRRRWRKTQRVLTLFPLVLFFPLGTVVGLVTFIILGSPTIRAAYEHEARV